MSRHAMTLVRLQGSGYIVWQEVFDDGVKLQKDAIVQIWKGNAWDIDRVTSQGLRALFSSCWYLDYISYGQDWDKYYMCNQVCECPRLPAITLYVLCCQHVVVVVGN